MLVGHISSPAYSGDVRIPTNAREWDDFRKTELGLGEAAVIMVINRDRGTPPGQPHGDTPVIFPAVRWFGSDTVHAAMRAVEELTGNIAESAILCLDAAAYWTGYRPTTREWSGNVRPLSLPPEPLDNTTPDEAE